MYYALRNPKGKVIDQEKETFIEELSFCDHTMYSNKPCFSFKGEYDSLDSFFHFNIDLKDAISLRNALNSFIEIQNIK